MAKKVAVLLADGFEEVEAVSPIDYLRRAGLDLSTVSIGKGKLVTGSHGIPVNADMLLSDLGDRGAAYWDAVVLPGGMPGASNLAASPAVGKFLKDMAAGGKLVAAICASPAVVLSPLGLLAGRRFTCFPGMEKQVDLSLNPGSLWLEDRVVVDGDLGVCRASHLKPSKIADQAIFYPANSVEPKVRSMPDNRDFCVAGGAKIHKCNRLLVTSRGAGTAGAFAVALIGLLLGEEEGKTIARTVLLS